jgi:phage-related protein
VEKRIFWSGSSKADLKAFPADARRVAGYQLWLVQLRRDPDDWKPLPTVGIGVREIRVHAGREHRVIYIASFAEGIYVLHAFEKKTRQTPKRDLELARTRLREIIRRRRVQHADRG